jgi:hypothetical protein
MVLVDTIQEGQRAGVIRPGSAEELALGHWAIVHGIASLHVEGRMLEERARERGGARGLARLVSEQIRLGLEPRP